MSNIKFGTGGFRAIIGEDFTKENIQKICQAISNIILKTKKTKKVCIGYDHRFMSEQFACWCCEVFAGNKIEVELFSSAVTTPVVMYAVNINNYDFGLMITASHNPHVYNGMKIFVKTGKDASVEETNQIEKEINCLKEVKVLPYLAATKKFVDFKSYINSYINNILKIAGIKTNNMSFKVVFDAKHGSSIEEIELLSKKIGLKTYEIINKNRDAFFDFKLPAPNIDNLDELKSKVKKDKADIGFALDADGDRLAVIDEKGNFIDNNLIIAIIYYFLVKYCGLKGDSVKNIATSNLIDIVTKKLGFKCHEVPVGFKYVSQAIINNDALVGGENSGGSAIRGHVLGKDSLMIVAICLKAMSVMKKPFSKILDEVKQFADNYSKVAFEKEYQVDEEKRQKIEDIVFKNKNIIDAGYEVEKIIFEDYIKVYYKNNNWFVIRFSGTEPILRIYGETDSKEECEIIAQKWKKFLKLK